MSKSKKKSSTDDELVQRFNDEKQKNITKAQLVKKKIEEMEAATSHMSKKDQIQYFINELKKEENADIETEALTKLMRSKHPYSSSIDSKTKGYWVNCSITHPEKGYMEKFITTALIGFLFRQLDKWKVPDDVPVIPMEEYLDDKKKADIPAAIFQQNNQILTRKYEFNKEWFKNREIVYSFLEEMFQFNPDVAVCSVYKPNRDDKSRKPIKTKAAKLAINKLRQKDREFDAKESSYEDLSNMGDNKNKEKPKVIITRKKLVDSKGNVKIVTSRKIVDNTASETIPIDQNAASKKEPPGDADPTITRTTRQIIPSEDTFYYLRNYMESNYEELQSVVADIYGATPMCEDAIMIYDVNETKEKADEFRQKNRDLFSCNVYPVRVGYWNIISPFKEVIESMQFLNGSTAALEAMMEQQQSDAKIGSHILKNRKNIMKKRNVIEAGKDDPAFIKWKQNNDLIKNTESAYIGDKSSSDLGPDELETTIYRVAETYDKILEKRIVLNGSVNNDPT